MESALIRPFLTLWVVLVFRLTCSTKHKVCREREMPLSTQMDRIALSSLIEDLRRESLTSLVTLGLLGHLINSNNSFNSTLRETTFCQWETMMKRTYNHQNLNLNPILLL